jgi:hypothetical protein
MNLSAFFYEVATFACPSLRERRETYYFSPAKTDGLAQRPSRGQSIQLVSDRVPRDMLALYPAYKVWLKVGREHFYFDAENRMQATHPLGRPEWYLITDRMDNVTAHRLMERWSVDISSAMIVLAAHMSRKDFTALESFVQNNSRLVP